MNDREAIERIRAYCEWSRRTHCAGSGDSIEALLTDDRPAASLTRASVSTGHMYGCDCGRCLAVAPRRDMRYPTGRPGWLGTYQPWPCGRCGKEEDAADPHDCQPPTEPVVLPDATKPLVGPGAIDGGK